MSGIRSLGDYDLVAYLDNEATSEERQEIESALAHDQDPATRVIVWRRNDEKLRAAFARVPHEPLPAALVLSCRSAQRAEASSTPDRAEPIRAPIRQVRRIERSHREQRGRLVSLTALSFAAGAILALSAAGLLGGAPRFLSAPAGYLFPGALAHQAGTRLAARALDAFLTFGGVRTHPVDATAPAETATWLTRRVGTPVRPPDLSRAGLRLLGARLTPGDNAPAALILFQTASGGRIGFYIGRSSAQLRTFHYSQKRHAGAVWWMENGAGYAVVGPADRVWLKKIALEARRQEPGGRP